MSVESKIKELLEGTNGDATSPAQGSSQKASFTEIDPAATNVNGSKDTSKSSSAATKGDGETKPRQGDSEDPKVTEIGEHELAIDGENGVKKDTSITAKVKGDGETKPRQGDSSDKVVEGVEGDEDETLEEISKNTLGNYVKKASKNAVVKGFEAGIRPEDNTAAVKAGKRTKGIEKAVNKLTKEDLDAQLNAIFGEELTEDFKEKASEIFEAAVIARVNDEIEAISEALEAKKEEQIKEAIESITEAVDSYLTEAVQSWVESNELAIASGLKLEIAENFLNGFKTLFSEHNVTVPDDGDLVEKLQLENAELQEKLNESIALNEELLEEQIEVEKTQIFEEIAEGLAKTEKSKFAKLVEGLDFKSEELYREKIEIIKETYFPKTQGKSAEESLSESVQHSMPNLQGDSFVELCAKNLTSKF